MKLFNSRLRLLFFLITAISLSHCKDDDNGPSEKDIKTEALMGKWATGSSGSVTRNEVALSEWNDFTINFDEGTYSTTNSDQKVWPSSGTWTFTSINPDRIERDGDLLIDVSLTGNTLQLTFQVNENTPGGRSESIEGAYVFTLVKQ